MLRLVLAATSSVCLYGGGTTTSKRAVIAQPYTPLIISASS